jgi:hypothetical protein
MSSPPGVSSQTGARAFERARAYSAGSTTYRRGAPLMVGPQDLNQETLHTRVLGNMLHMPMTWIAGRRRKSEHEVPRSTPLSAGRSRSFKVCLSAFIADAGQVLVGMAIFGIVTGLPGRGIVALIDDRCAGLAAAGRYSGAGAKSADTCWAGDARPLVAPARVITPRIVVNEP